MRILVADDSVEERNLLAGFLARRGHSVEWVEDGQGAVNAAAREAFDLVLMDSIMPNMVGNQAVRLIRKQDKQGGHYTPVIFVSSLDDPSEIVASLGFGADDYLIKPIDWDVLEAKLRVFARISSQHRALEKYRLAAEADKAFGRQVLEHLTRANRSFGDDVRHFSRPADQLSGDLFAYARASGGVTYALLADAMGHGLPPSLTAVLLADLFYAMAKRNQPLAVIAAEANSKLKALVPAGFFIAAAFVRMEPHIRRLQVWNGGIPLVRLLDRQRVLKAFPSTHPALAVLAPHEFDATVDEFVSPLPGELLLATDGLTEALGEALPDDAACGFDEIMGRLDGIEAQDDVSLAALKVP